MVMNKVEDSNAEVDTMSTFKEILHLQSGVHIHHESAATRHLPVSYFSTMLTAGNLAFHKQ